MATGDDKKQVTLSASDFGEKAPRQARENIPADVAESGITASDFDTGSGSFAVWGLLPFAAFLAVGILQFLYFNTLYYEFGDYYWVFRAFIATMYALPGFMAFRAARALERSAAGRKRDWLLGTVMIVLGVILTVAVRDPAYLLHGELYLRFGVGGFGVSRLFVVLLPLAAIVFLNESAIRGVVIGQLEQLRRKPTAIVATAAVFDFLASLTVIGALFSGSGEIGFVIRVIIATVLAGVCLSILRLAFGRVMPCIVVGLVGVVLTQFVRLG